MKSHRLDSSSVSVDETESVGADGRVFPTGVNHVRNHQVPHVTHDEKAQVGPYIKDIGQGSTVFHGVEDKETGAQIHDEWEKAQKAATFPAGITKYPEPKRDPVPVTIVDPDSGANELRSWSGTYTSVSNTEVQVIGRNAKRTRVILLNEDATNPVRLGRRIGNSVFGYLLAAGQSLEMYTQDAVYAIAVTASTTVRVSVYQEYGITGGM